ncbi:hypothetical protein ETAA8_40330 [Anatilimnocola aggregata]|uniref:Uncharacterized protein n=1 Tax=Anatilimnocola aggregata TaxID=2528021 RepID=A0A517YFB8_9BACT|nr:Imm50 family immunity protein [Anatilimnocola aggregata]QDU28927.1 hypothetical protein ETAA8_40330 [Anatilimnocola aggregata]
MAWYDECDNPKIISGYYSTLLPLNRIDLHEVVLHRDGPLLKLRGNLPVFPDRPSKRWPEQANTAQVTIALWGVSSVSIREWATTIEGTFALERLGPQRLSFSFCSDATTIRGECDSARIDEITAYIKGAA